MEICGLSKVFVAILEEVNKKSKAFILHFFIDLDMHEPRIDTLDPPLDTFSKSCFLLIKRCPILVKFILDFDQDITN